MVVNEPTAAILNRFSDEKYQRRNWNHLETTIKTAVNNLIPPELQTLNRIPSSSNNSTEFLTLISEHITRTSADLLSLSGNLIRGRGLFCNACFEFQRHDHAALIAVVSSKHPQIGHLLLRRLVSEIKVAHERHNFASLTLLTKLLAHLINQRVSTESLGFELVNLFLYSGESPSDAIVTIALEFVQQCGAALRNADSEQLDGVLDRLRELLSERRNSRLYSDISDDYSKVKVIVQAMASLRSAEFINDVRVVPELDVVSEKERVTHSDISLYDDKRIEMTEIESGVFSYDPDFFDAYVAGFRSEIEYQIMARLHNGGGPAMGLEDIKAIYDMIEDVEGEVCWMIVELCGQHDSYKTYFGELGKWMQEEFKTGYKAWRDCFIEVYDKIEGFEKKKVVNVGRLFGNLMVTRLRVDAYGRECVTEGDGMPWEYVLGNLRLGDKTESEAARVFIKVMFSELDIGMMVSGCPSSGVAIRNSILGIVNRKKGFKIGQIFPSGDVRKSRIWIEYFRSIGLTKIAEYGQQELTASHTINNARLA